MDDMVISVVIPAGENSAPLGPCLDAVLGQDHERKEVIVVLDPRAPKPERLPPSSRHFRVIKERNPATTARLINSGMCAARGHVKIMLMPHCIPSGDGWMRRMAQPFENDEVGVVVSQRRMFDGDEPGLPARLLDALNPQHMTNPAAEPCTQEIVSHLCDAYRASLLADIGYFADDSPRSPAEAVEISVKIADAGYSIVLSDAATVTISPPHGRRALANVLSGALDYGHADATLARTYDMQWLNAGVFAAACFSLLLLPIAAISVPGAIVLSAGVLLSGMVLAVRLPLLKWEMPVFVLNFAVYALIILWLRGDWRPGLFGSEVHPAFIRKVAWLVAITGTYLVILLKAGLTAAVRAWRRPQGSRYAAQVLPLSMVWWLLAGIGHLNGRIAGKPGGE